jgi:hypothetical protein
MPLSRWRAQRMGRATLVRRFHSASRALSLRGCILNAVIPKLERAQTPGDRWIPVSPSPPVPLLSDPDTWVFEAEGWTLWDRIAAWASGAGSSVTWPELPEQITIATPTSGSRWSPSPTPSVGTGPSGLVLRLLRLLWTCGRPSPASASGCSQIYMSSSPAQRNYPRRPCWRSSTTWRKARGPI